MSVSRLQVALDAVGKENRLFREERDEWRRERVRLEDALHSEKMTNLLAAGGVDQAKGKMDELAQRCMFLEELVQEQRDNCEQLEGERTASRSGMEHDLRGLEMENEALRTSLASKDAAIQSYITEMERMKQMQDVLESRTSKLANTASLTAVEYDEPDDLPPPLYTTPPAKPLPKVPTTVIEADWADVVSKKKPDVTVRKAVPVGRATVTATNKKIAITQEKDGWLLLYNPEKMELMSRVKIGNPARCCSVMDNVALVVADYKVKSIDITNLRKPGGAVKVDGMGGDVIGLTIKSPYCFVSCKKKLKIFELKKEKKVLTPVLISALNGVELTGLRVYNHILYGASGHNIEIIDISDIQNPHLIRSMDMQTPVQGLTISGTTGFVCTKTGLKTIDLTNPEKPWISGRLSKGVRMHSLDIKGQAAFYVEESDGRFLYSTIPVEVLMAAK